MCRLCIQICTVSVKSNSVMLSRVSMPTHAERDTVLSIFCLSLRPSNAGMVSKRIDTLFNILIGASFCFFLPYRRYKIPREPLSGGVKYKGWEFFFQISPLLSETVQDRDIVTVEY